MKKSDDYKWMSSGDKIIYEDFMTYGIDTEDDLIYTPDEFESHFNKWKEEKGYKLNYNMKLLLH